MRASWCEAKFTYVTLVTIVHIRLTKSAGVVTPTAVDVMLHWPEPRFKILNN
jgi:hypothetical protein